MRILMCTNTYLPHVGGVARSVSSLAGSLIEGGDQVLVVAPEFEEVSGDEEGVVRVPAIQNFNGTDFSVQVPAPFYLTSAVHRFAPDIIHSHHPFLLGDTAQRIAAVHAVPLVFTHHTLYEHYTHYVPGDSDVLKEFVKNLATEYANLCDGVIAPSQSIAQLIAKRGVTVPIEIIPTGIDTAKFAGGSRTAARKRFGITADQRVIGHVGRLAPEKNLDFLARAVAIVLSRDRTHTFLVIGNGPSREAIREICRQAGVEARLHLPGSLSGQELFDAYSAMDLFVFSSKSETQGMVLAEAMAAGLPVAALDASGAREIVVTGRNGVLLMEENEESFAAAVEGLLSLDPPSRKRLVQQAKGTAENFSLINCRSRARNFYERLIGSPNRREVERDAWNKVMRLISRELELISSKASAIGDTFT